MCTLSSVESQLDETGVWHHVFHQSDLSTYLMCPEMLRDRRPDQESDATLIGTTAHLGIEHYLAGWGDDRVKFVEMLRGYFVEQWPEVRHIQDHNMDTAWAKADRAFAAFWKNREQFPVGGMIEQQFTFAWHVDAFRTISFRGAIDYFHPAFNMIWDWKTEAAKYHGQGGKAWVKRRYAVQPTVYVTGAQQALQLEETPGFTFVRLPKDGSDMELLPVERDAHDKSAVLTELSLGLAHLVEAGLPRWPMSPSDWWCSAKWCDKLRSGECMGKYLDKKPWNVQYMNINTKKEM